MIGELIEKILVGAYSIPVIRAIMAEQLPPVP
jgi:hypothetical protein